MDSALRLLQALNDQKTNFFKAAVNFRLQSWAKSETTISKCLSADDVKDWINNDVDPKQLRNPVRDFQNVASITCLAFASLVNDAQTVRQLVESGADVRATDWSGCTPLHYACASRVEAQAKVEYMLQRDASLVNATNYSPNRELLLKRFWILPRYSTPLHMAVGHNQPACVKTLVKDFNAPVNVDACGWTALQIGALAGSAEAMKMLLHHPDCNVNYTNNPGLTALRFAVLSKHRTLAAVNVIASHPNCDFSITSRGRTAADEARRHGHNRIAALIEEKSRGSLANTYEHMFSQLYTLLLTV